MSTIKDFTEFLSFFLSTSTWEEMVSTVEDSPWHREDNVAVHTMMALQVFTDKFAHKYTEHEQIVGSIALLFHDAGKPEAEEVLEKKDGSGEKYRRYAGHEQNSAITFQQSYLKYAQLRKLLTPEQARAIRWIIEHHLPYGVKDAAKRQSLATGTFNALCEAGVSYDLFFDCLRSDAAGRISDDHETKLQNVEDWIANFRLIEIPENKVSTAPKMYILSGPSGSGKSTFVKKHINPDIDVVISYDDFRLSLWRQKHGDQGLDTLGAKNEYKKAFEYASLNEKEFNAHMVENIKKLMHRTKATGGQVFIDNVNASKKSRAKFVELAKQYGLTPIGVEFWNRFETVVNRQDTRGDKSVPVSSIKQQMFSSSLFSLGHEVNQVQMVVEDA